MFTQTDKLVTRIDQFVSRVGPINTMINAVVDRIAPKATAKACHGGGAYCKSVRGAYCWSYCDADTACKVIKVYSETVWYGTNCNQSCFNWCTRHMTTTGSCSPC